MVTIKRQSVTLAKMSYPVLMVADIMLYRPDSVPVGEDQRQHIEFYNVTARKVKTLFNINLNLIRPSEENIKVMDLKNYQDKMSKSSSDDKGIIFIDDDPVLIRNKFKKAYSGSAGIDFDSPSIKNLMLICSKI